MEHLEPQANSSEYKYIQANWKLYGHHFNNYCLAIDQRYVPGNDWGPETAGWNIQA